MKAWRLASVKGPYEFPPLKTYPWNNRFDDIKKQYRTMYFGESNLTCLREVLADLRPNAKFLADFESLFGAGGAMELLVAGEVSKAWREHKVLLQAEISVAGDLCDVDDVQVRNKLEKQHAALLKKHGLDHLNISEIRSKNREVSRTISRTIFESGAAGIRFKSNLDDQPCYAFFEGRVEVKKLDKAPLIRLTELVPELVQVCGEFTLVLRPC